MTEQDELYSRNPDFIFRRIIDETILVPVHRDLAEMDCIYTLNELGALLWERLETPASKIELRKAILDTYDAAEDTAAADLDRFLEEMQSIGALLRA